MVWLLGPADLKEGWARSGLLFNGPGTSWLDLELAARNPSPAAGAVQTTLDFDGDTDGGE